MHNLTSKFEEYLKLELQVSGKTLRNYRADLGHFLRWSKEHLADQEIVVDDLQSLLPHFSHGLVASYKTHHTQDDVPQSTINRRLSTLRNLSKFLVCTGFLQHNPAQLVTNLKLEPTWEQKSDVLIKEFAEQLEKDGATHTTRKNYLSDVRQFLAWIEKDNKKQLPGSLPGSS